MTIEFNISWVRVFDHAGGAFAFTTFFVCSSYLASRRYIGHRPLLAHTAIWTGLRSVLSVELMWSSYWGNHTSLFVTACLTMATMAGCTLSIHILAALADLLITLTRTEAAEMVRRDHTADTKQTQQLFEYMSLANRETSQNILAEAKRGNL